MAFSFEKVGQVVTVYKADTTQHRAELKKLSKEQQAQHKEVIDKLEAQSAKYDKAILGIKKMHSSIMLLSAAFPILGQVAGRALDTISRKAEQGYREIFRAAQMLDRYVLKRRNVNFSEETDPRAMRISELKNQLEMAKEGPSLWQIGYAGLTGVASQKELASDYLQGATQKPQIEAEIARLQANLKFTGGQVGAGKMPALPFAGSTTGIGHWEMNPDTLMWAWVAGEPAPVDKPDRISGARAKASGGHVFGGLWDLMGAPGDLNAAAGRSMMESLIKRLSPAERAKLQARQVGALGAAGGQLGGIVGGAFGGMGGVLGGMFGDAKTDRELVDAKAADIMGSDNFKVVSSAMMGSFQAVIAGSMGVSQAMRAMFGQVLAGYSAKLFGIGIEQSVLAAVAAFTAPPLAGRHAAAAALAFGGAAALGALANKLGTQPIQGNSRSASGFGRGMGGGGGGRSESRTFIIGDGFGDDSPRRRASKIRRMLDDDDKRGGGSSGGRWN